MMPTQHARQALEDHRNERDAHQIDGQQSLVVAAKTGADDRHQRLCEQRQHRGEADEGQPGQAEHDADQSPELALVTSVLHEYWHKGGRAHCADQEVVQNRRHGAGEHERVGTGSGAKGEGDDHIAQQAEAATQNVAKGNDCRCAR